MSVRYTKTYCVQSPVIELGLSRSSQGVYNLAWIHCEDEAENHELNEGELICYDSCMFFESDKQDSICMFVFHGADGSGGGYVCIRVPFELVRHVEVKYIEEPV